MNKYIVIAVVIVVFLLIFNRFRSAMSTDSNKVKEKIQQGALVVDVRSPAEFKSGHFPGAINIPVDEVSKRIGEFGTKENPIIVYCASGGRSGSAKSFLESMGYKDVINAGGLSNMPK